MVKSENRPLDWVLHTLGVILGLLVASSALALGVYTNALPEDLEAYICMQMRTAEDLVGKEVAAPIGC